MTPIRICLFLVSLSLLTGGEPPRTSSASAGQLKSALADEEAFAKIVDYYQKMFPTASFSDGRNIHESDGPERGAAARQRAYCRGRGVSASLRASISGTAIEESGWPGANDRGGTVASPQREIVHPQRTR